MKNQKGFTLVELLAAMAIIAVLIGLAVFGINLAQRSARNTQRRSAARDISLAVQAYYEQNGAYPASITWAAGSATVATGNVVTLTGPTSYKGAITTGNPAAPSAAADGTYWSYGTTTNGYKICVNLEGVTASYNGGTDSAAACP
jgi:prepilin-type N-terminal cleavage/methylation domain-containing protein